MPPITLILKPNPTRDNVPRTGPAAAAGHVGRDPVDAADSRSLNDRVIATGLARGGKSYFTRERGGTQVSTAGRVIVIHPTKRMTVMLGRPAGLYIVCFTSTRR